MKWTYRRIGWFTCALGGSLISIICSLAIVVIAYSTDFYQFYNIYPVVPIICCLFSAVIFFVDIYYALKPSSPGFQVTFLSAIISAIVQVASGILLLFFVENKFISQAQSQWPNYYKRLLLDEVQKYLKCCGFDSQEEMVGRNGFCYRYEKGTYPTCKEKIISNVKNPTRIFSIFILIAALLNVGATVFNILLKKADPDEEFSPDAETMLAAGLL